MSQGAEAGEQASSAMRQLLEAPKLALDRAPVLQAIFDRMAAECADEMRAFCTSTCTFMLNGIKAGNTWDLLEPYEDGFGAFFLAVEWDALVVIGCDRRFVFSIIEAMYGADGTEAPYESGRPFTALEIRVVREILGRAAAALQAQVATVAPTTLKLERTETSLDFATIGLRDAPAIMAQLISQVMDGGGRMFVLIPNAALAPFRKRLERDRPVETPAVDPSWSRQMQLELGRTEVLLTAAMDGPQMTLEQICALRPGQLLVLKSTPETPLAVEAEEHLLFRATLGQSKGAFTIRIERKVDEREELLSNILAGDEAG